MPGPTLIKNGVDQCFFQSEPNAKDIARREASLFHCADNAFLYFTPFGRVARNLFVKFFGAGHGVEVHAAV